MLGAGCLELATYVVSKQEKNDRAGEKNKLIRITNPVSDDYNALRDSIMPNLLGVLSKNTHQPYPQKLFELGDVAIPNMLAETRADTVHRLCAVSAHSEANLSEIAGLLAVAADTLKLKFELKKTDSPQFISGRQAAIVANGKEIGKIGEISPQVLERMGIQMPVAAFEVSIP